MAELEEKLNSILSDPKMMRTILSMAQSLSGQAQSQPNPQDSKQSPPSVSPPPVPGGAEFELLSKAAEFSRQANLSQEEQALLKALGPYLSQGRVGRLERAMRAARLAQLATAAMGQSGGQSHNGR